MEQWRRFLRGNPLVAALILAAGMSVTGLWFGTSPVITFPFAFLLFWVMYQRRITGAPMRPLIITLTLLTVAMVVLLAIRSLPH
jgi:hypothetical protein